MTGPGLSHLVPTWLARLSRIARLHGRAGPAAFSPCRDRASTPRSWPRAPRRWRRVRAAHAARRRRGAAGGRACARGDRAAARRRDGGGLSADPQRDRSAAGDAGAGAGSATGSACRWSRRRAGRWRSGPGAPGAATERGAFGVEVPVGGRAGGARRAAGAAARLRRARAPAGLWRRLLRPDDRRASGAAAAGGARARLCRRRSCRRCRTETPTCGSTAIVTEAGVLWLAG